jgi:glycosyltransferase involved in cell wall biosynthesis
LKQYKGVRIQHLPSLRTKHLDAITHTFVSALHAMATKHDIIHFHGVGPALMAWLPRLFSSSKVVVTFHCIDRFHQKWGVFARLMLRLGEWAANKFAHETIAVSQSIAQYCALEYDNAVQYIPNGVNVPERYEADKITQLFGLEKDSYIVMVSRLVRHKGAHFLIDAYNQLKTDKKLVIVGGSTFTDDYVEELHEMAKDNPNIIFTGFQNGQTLGELFTNAYMYVHPSISEGLPISVLEALSYQQCAVVSNIPENLEAVREHGMVFESQNVEQLAEKMQYLLENPQEVAKKRAAGFKHVMNEYNWEDITEQTEKLYKELMYTFMRKSSYRTKNV